MNQPPPPMPGPPPPGHYLASDGRWYPVGAPPPAPKKSGPGCVGWLVIFGVAGFVVLVVAVALAPRSSKTAAPTGSAAPVGTLGPKPAADLAKDITVESLAGRVNARGEVTEALGHVDVIYDNGGNDSNQAAIDKGFADAAEILPKLFARPELGAVDSFCLHRQVEFTDALGKSTGMQDATKICVARSKATDVDLNGTTPERFYEATRGKLIARDGIEFTMHPSFGR